MIHNNRNYAILCIQCYTVDDVRCMHTVLYTHTLPTTLICNLQHLQMFYFRRGSMSHTKDLMCCRREAHVSTAEMDVPSVGFFILKYCKHVRYEYLLNTQGRANLGRANFGMFCGSGHGMSWNFSMADPNMCLVEAHHWGYPLAKGIPWKTLAVLCIGCLGFGFKHPWCLDTFFDGRSLQNLFQGAGRQPWLLSPLVPRWRLPL